MSCLDDMWQSRGVEENEALLSAAGLLPLKLKE